MSKQFEKMKWYEFNDKTLREAKQSNKPIFLFITYESCRLCDEMQNSVFRNKECFELLNNNFISILVDKDKRADIDKYFQKAHSIINKTHGGWPLCVFCTPSAKAFFSKTYMTLESKGSSFNDIGILEVANIINEKISSNDAATLKNADEIEQFLLKDEHPTQATRLSEDFAKNYMHQVKNNYQTKYGGFSSVPKFPHSNTLNTLMLIDKIYDDKPAKAMVTTTLKNMANSCIKNSGFARYYVSDDWSISSDDKTLYDNALLCQTYTYAFIQYNERKYLDIANICADFCIKFNSDIVVQKAMMTGALLTLSSLENKYLKTALRELEKILSNSKINLLEEFSFIASALIKAYKATKEEHYLIKATQFTNKALERFYNHGGWLFCDNEFKTKADITDNVYTSCVSVMIKVLIDLGELLKDEKYLHYAYKTLEYNSYELARNSIYYPSMLNVMLEYIKIKEMK